MDSETAELLEPSILGHGTDCDNDDENGTLDCPPEVKNASSLGDPEYNPFYFYEVSLVPKSMYHIDCHLNHVNATLWTPISPKHCLVAFTLLVRNVTTPSFPFIKSNKVHFTRISRACM